MAETVKPAKKVILPVYVDINVYHDITSLSAIESRKTNRLNRKSEFVQEKILKPYIAKAKAAGVLK